MSKKTLPRGLLMLGNPIKCVKTMWFQYVLFYIWCICNLSDETLEIVSNFWPENVIPSSKLLMWLSDVLRDRTHSQETQKQGSYYRFFAHFTKKKTLSIAIIGVNIFVFQCYRNVSVFSDKFNGFPTPNYTYVSSMKPVKYIL